MKRALWGWTLLLVAIAVAVALRRIVFLLGPSRPDALGGGFAAHPALTLAHIAPGLLFVVLGPLQFVRGLRSWHPPLHCWSGRVLIVSGVVIGATALAMSTRMAIGGVSETAATVLFAILFLVALAKGFVAIRRGKVAEHREWMIRAFAIGLAVAFVRPVVGIFFATARLTHLTPHDFFGTAFWLGFTIQTMAAEVWIQSTRRA